MSTKRIEPLSTDFQSATLPLSYVNFIINKNKKIIILNFTINLKINNLLNFIIKLLKIIYNIKGQKGIWTLTLDFADPHTTIMLFGINQILIWQREESNLLQRLMRPTSYLTLLHQLIIEFSRIRTYIHTFKNILFNIFFNINPFYF